MSTRGRAGSCASAIAILLILPGCSTTTVTAPYPPDQGTAAVGPHPGPTVVDSLNVSFPALDPGIAVLTRDYLKTGGALIEEFRTAVGPMTSIDQDAAASSTISVCTSVAEDLDTVNPTDLLKVAEGVPDSVLGDLFVTERRLVSDALVACGRGDSVAMDRALHNLMNTVSLADRRLREVQS